MTSTSEMNGLLQLSKANIENNKLENTKVLKLVADKETLKRAYHVIKSKPGNMTAGIDNKTLDRIKDQDFDKLSSDIGSGRFKFNPSRVVEIPKSNGKTRKLSVSSPRDKIVQQAIMFVLQAIFEPGFSDNSHGFRPGRSCHSALKQVHLTFQACNWYVELDIAKSFDTLDHKVIIALLQERIKDQGFIDLIRKALNAGCIDLSGFKPTILGAPQGSIISPILCNIYLTLVDNWLERYIQEHNVGNRAKANPVYTKLLRGHGNKTRAEQRRTSRFIRDNKIRSFISSDSFRRFRFVRYADDIIIGVWGSKEDCIYLKKDLELYLNTIGLKMSQDKTLITNSTTSKALFLGTEIFNTRFRSRQTRKIVTKMNRVVTTNFPGRPQLKAPLDRIFKKLMVRGYCKANYKPTFVGRLLYLPELEIVSNFCSVARGILNYYSFASNFTVLRHKVLYVLKYSCAMTLGNKLKLNPVKKVFSKFGFNLGLKDSNGTIRERFKEDIVVPKDNRGFKTATYNPLSVVEINVSKSFKRTNAIFYGPCKICGTDRDIEVHHVRKLGGLDESKDYLTNLMIRINRKQVPLCKKCHHIVHNGGYCGPKL